MYQAVLFDMDGTILDTITDLTICTNYALSQLGKPHEFPAELVKLCYGCGIEADMQKALAMAAGCAGEDLEYVENPTPLSSYGLTAQDTARLQSIFVPYYSAHCHLHTTPYDGIPALLSTLRKRGIRTAVASNKDEADVAKLAALHFPGLFDTIMGNSPAIHRKPAPDMLDRILHDLSIPKEQAVYIGDSEVDIETAKNAGLACISVTWGFRNKSFLARHGATRIVENATELAMELGMRES